jgi:hypothetical protein
MYARARESPRREQSLGDFLVRRTSRSRRARLAEGQQRSNPRWCRQGLVHGWAMAAAKTSRSAREAQPGRNDVMVGIGRGRALQWMQRTPARGGVAGVAPRPALHSLTWFAQAVAWGGQPGLGSLREPVIATCMQKIAQNRLLARLFERSRHLGPLVGSHCRLR